MPFPYLGDLLNPGMEPVCLLSPDGQVGSLPLHYLGSLHEFLHPSFTLTIPGDSVVKNLLANAGDLGSVPGSGGYPGGGNGNPLQYSCLRIPWTEEPGGLHFMGLQRVGHN